MPDSASPHRSIKIAGPNGKYYLLSGDSEGRLHTSSQRSAFGEDLVAQPSPVVQLSFPYNINATFAESRENNAGTVTQSNSMAVLSTGASTSSAATLVSRVPIRYQPGQGVVSRFTGVFTTGVANSTQMLGVGDAGDGLFFGYNGATFGLLHRRGGGPEIQTLTITTGAVTSGGNITITLDGVAKTVAVALNDTAREVAVKVADADFSDTGAGWNAVTNNATVIFTAWSGGNKAGSFAFADTDTTGVAASIAETVAGAAPTDTWIAQTAWNQDVMDGTGVSGMTLDPTQGNVYEVRYQWLGFGQLSFYVEDSNTGDFQLVHRIAYANANTTPSMINPTLPLCAMVENTTNDTDITLSTASMSAFIEGQASDQAAHFSDGRDLTNITTTELPVISLKNNVVHQSKVNRVRVILQFLEVAVEHSKPMVIRVRKNAALTGAVAFTAVDAATSVSSIDKGASGASGGALIDTISLSKVGERGKDMRPLFIELDPGDTLTVTAVATSGTNAEAFAGISWSEFF